MKTFEVEFYVGEQRVYKATVTTEYGYKNALTQAEQQRKAASKVPGHSGHNRVIITRVDEEK